MASRPFLATATMCLLAGLDLGAAVLAQRYAEHRSASSSPRAA
ncbi:MAG: hypothetical protein R2705_00605 [Ilumatobacteraceae bacterium]